jgi:DNA topoisomerase-1
MTGTGVLGADPATGLAVSVKRGPDGIYVELEALEGGKPKRASLTKDMNPAEIDLAKALQLLELPREIGRDPQSGNTISAGIGRFGPYLKSGDLYVQLPADENVLTIGLNRAIDLVVAKHENLAKRLIRDFGKNPKTGDEVTAYRGRFGPYLKCGKLMANVPKGIDLDALALDEAIALLQAKAKAPAKKGKSAASKKAAAKPRAKAKKA